MSALVYFEILAVPLLVLLNAFFVAAEYGLVTSRRTRIRELEREGNRRARDVLKITANPPRAGRAPQSRAFARALTPRPCGEMIKGMAGSWFGRYQEGRSTYAFRAAPS